MNNSGLVVSLGSLSEWRSELTEMIGMPCSRLERGYASRTYNEAHHMTSSYEWRMPRQTTLVTPNYVVPIASTVGATTNNAIIIDLLIFVLPPLFQQNAVACRQQQQY